MGIVFPHTPYTEDEEALLLDIFKDSRRWEQGQCFYNAQVLAVHDDRLEYAEGYVLAPDVGLPLDHAWNFLPASGKPVDLTIRRGKDTTTCKPDRLLARAVRNLENAYRGVVIPTTEVIRLQLKTRMAQSLLQYPPILEKILFQGLPRTWGHA